MEKLIIEYKENNPKTGYYTLTKIFGLSIENVLDLLNITNHEIDKYNIIRINDNNGNKIYYEDSSGDWQKSTYDSKGNRTYIEDSNGYWHKTVYDDNSGNIIYYEDSDGYWSKREYDNKGNETYYENSNGFWRKHEYDDNNNEVYSETSRE